MPGTVGGVGQARDADGEVQAICDQIKAKVEEQCKTKFSQFTAHSYSTQVVAGTNFFVKVQIGDGEYVHVRIFKPLPPHHSNVEFVGIQQGKNQEDALEYF